MRSQPVEADWELFFPHDLAPYLIPAAGYPSAVYRPTDTTWLPDGAHSAIVECVGRVGLEDVLVIPAAAWPAGRRQCRYSPQCVAAMGERGVALWVQALPAPGIRAQMPFGEIAAIEHLGDGPRRVLVVTGRMAGISVRYDAVGQVVDAWTRRLRLRAAAAPGPVPTHPRGSGPRDENNLGSLLLAPDDAIVSAGWRSRAGRGACLLSITSRELVVVQSLPNRRRPWRRTTRTVYVPRGSIEDAVVQSTTVQIRSVGTDVRIGLHSRRVAAAASSWLRWMLGDSGRQESTGPPRTGGPCDRKRQ